MSAVIREYSAERSTATLAASVEQCCHELWNTREIIWSLFVRDLKVQYRQKILGYFWAMLNPLISVAVFVFLSSAGVLRPGQLTIPYPLFVLFGIGVWSLFVASVQSVGGSLLTHGDLIIRTNVPRLSLALAGLAGVLFSHSLHLATLMACLVWFQVMPSWGILLYPLLVIPLVALGIALGLMVSLFGALARDLTTMVMTMLSFLMFCTPVIFTTTDFKHPALRLIVTMNPLSYLVDAPRSLFFTGTVESPLGLLIAVMLSAVMLMLSIHVFYRVQDKIVERL